MLFLLKFFLFFASLAIFGLAAALVYFGRQPTFVSPLASLKTITLDVEAPKTVAANFAGHGVSAYLVFYQNLRSGFQPMAPGAPALGTAVPNRSDPEHPPSAWPMLYKIPPLGEFHVGQPADFSVDREFLHGLSASEGKREVWFNLVLCVSPDPPPQPTDANSALAYAKLVAQNFLQPTCQAVAMAYRFHELTDAEIDAPDPLKLGRTVISRFTKGATLELGAPRCETGDTALAGKVLATQPFLQDFPADHTLALVALPFPPNHAVNLAAGNYYVSELKPNAEGVPFKFARDPKLGNNAKDFTLLAFVCDPKESVVDCAARKLPTAFPPRSEFDAKNEVFHLVPQELQSAACGTGDLKYFLHRFPEKPTVPRSKELPPELDESGLYL